MASPNSCFAKYLLPTASAAPVSSEGKKKTRGVRGVAAPRLNPSREASPEGSGGAKPPQPKFGGSGKTENFSKIFRFGLGALPPRPPEI